MRSYLAILVLLIIVTVLAVVGLRNFQQGGSTKSITSFAECKNAGYPIQEIFPEQCRTPDGRMFTNESAVVEVTVTGEIVCVPHKNQKESNTLVCPYGIRDAEGKYYGLMDSDPQYKNMQKAKSGKLATVTGRLERREDKNYPIVGVITMKSLTPK